MKSDPPRPKTPAVQIAQIAASALVDMGLVFVLWRFIESGEHQLPNELVTLLIGAVGGYWSTNRKGGDGGGTKPALLAMLSAGGAAMAAKGKAAVATLIGLGGFLALLLSGCAGTTADQARYPVAKACDLIEGKFIARAETREDAERDLRRARLACDGVYLLIDEVYE